MTTSNSVPSTRAAVHLRGPLDNSAVSELLDRISSTPDASEVVVDCSGISSVDPVGAARLWILGRELEGMGRIFRILSLPERFLRRMRLHPLIRYAELDDAIFTDPFAQAMSSR